MKIVLVLPLLIISLFILPAPCRAEYGIKGGINFANIGPRDNHFPGGLTDPRAGMVAGIFCGFNLSKDIFIQPEIYYSQKGVKSEIMLVGGPNSSLTETIKLNYLEMPVLVGVLLRGRTSIRPYIFTGPYLGFKLSPHLLKKTDFGFVIGAGTRIKTRTGYIHLESRYTSGLIRLETDNISPGKNRVFGLMVGYSFL